MDSDKDIRSPRKSRYTRKTKQSLEIAEQSPTAEDSDFVPLEAPRQPATVTMPPTGSPQQLPPAARLENEDTIRRIVIECMSGTSRFPFMPTPAVPSYPSQLQATPLYVQQPLAPQYPQPQPPAPQLLGSPTPGSTFSTFEEWMNARPKVTLSNLSQALHLLRIRFPAEQQAIRDEINKIIAEWAPL